MVGCSGEGLLSEWNTKLIYIVQEPTECLSCSEFNLVFGGSRADRDCCYPLKR